jgi:plasmid stability protein
MKTLYIRNVPDDVTARLELLAARDGMSVSAFVLRELSEASRRADNAALLGALSDVGVAPEDVVGELDAARAAR